MFANYKVHMDNNCTPQPPAKRKRVSCSPDEGCYESKNTESRISEGSRRKDTVHFDDNVDSLLCLHDKGDEGYFSPSFEAQDGVKGRLDDAELDLKIGPPLFESSLCHDDETANSTWESTLPLQVQVKSVVIPVEGAGRPYLEREKEEKEKYINAVTRHMQERDSTQTKQDVMGELLSLMSAVADDAHGSQWQHPSDLTRRNYQKRFETTTKMTLEEWEEKNDPKLKRFAKLPKIF